MTRSPPQRLSVVPNDPGNNPAIYHYEVFFDGIKQYAVITADAAQGYIERYVVKENGDFEVVGGALRMERVYGRVTFVPIEEAPGR